MKITKDALILAQVLGGSGGGGGGGVPGGYTVTFMVDGSVYAVSSVLPGGEIERPEMPIFNDKVFGYWCTTEDGTGEDIEFPYAPTEDITLYCIKFDPWLTYKSSSSFHLQFSYSKPWAGTVVYSTDKTNWTEWNGTTAANAALVDGEYVLYIRGTGNTTATGNRTYPMRYSWTPIGASNPVDCIGQIATVLDYNTVLQGKTVATGTAAFCGFFYSNQKLRTAPHLDFLTMSSYIFYDMFYNSYLDSILEKAPHLPYKDLATSCYSGMFYGCSQLTTFPSLPATTLQDSCYSSMFGYCSKLHKPPKIRARAGAQSAFSYMYANCVNIDEIQLFDMGVVGSMMAGMYNGCTKIKISTEESEEYHNSFVLPSGGTNAYQNMFANTGGTFTGTPTAGTTYYTPNTVKVV